MSRTTRSDLGTPLYAFVVSAFRLQRWRGSCPLRSIHYGTTSGRRVCQQASTWRDWRLYRLRWALVRIFCRVNVTLCRVQMTRLLKSNILVVRHYIITHQETCFLLWVTLHWLLVGSRSFSSTFASFYPRFLCDGAARARSELMSNAVRQPGCMPYVTPRRMTETRIALVFSPFASLVSN